MASSKLRLYRLFKNTLEYESYLNLLPYLRAPLACLRTSAHGLRIETGCYKTLTPTLVEEKLCDLCEVIEDQDFILIAPGNRLLSDCAVLLPSFEYMASKDKFILLRIQNCHH